MTASEFRKLCKEEIHVTHTSGSCPGYAQANLLVLPKSAAADFENLCKRNPVPCPLIGTTPLGNPFEVDNKKVISDKEFDIRSDFPKYNVYQGGKLIATKLNVRDEWDPESHVGFLIGCSFSFEKALERGGLAPKNFKINKNVSMYKTTKMLDAAGIFYNVPYVVSMRPYKSEDINKVRSITGEFKKTHGEPIDWGFDACDRLGIKDISCPDYGDACEIGENEIPVFWGCGVTPQIAAAQVGDKIEGVVIGHAPGHMLVLDTKDEEVVDL